MKCPKCKKIMQIKSQDQSNNPDNGRHYQRIIYFCRKDDVWITSEVPIKSLEVKLGRYLHYKGSEANVIGEATHSETQEEFVAYWHTKRETGENKLWVRPKKMFLEKVTVNGKKIPRFKYIKK